MEHYLQVFRIWIYLCISAYVPSLYGLTCTCDNVQENQPLDCQCETANSIRWYFEKNNVATCAQAICIPSSVPGYTFSHTGSTYRMTISNFSLINCKKYSCTDQQALQRAYFPYCPGLTMIKPVSNGTINIAENTTEEFQCEIRSGYPAGTVEWYMDSKTPDEFDDDVKITVGITHSSRSSPTDNQEYITTSALLFPAPRSDTGNRIYCKATNKLEQTPLISQRKPLINVLFDAGDGEGLSDYCEGPTIQEGTSYRVIENTSGQLACIVTGGNPHPTIQWNCNGGTETSTSNGNRTSNTVIWTANKGDSNRCTCSSTQTGLQSRSALINIYVLYPPSAPIFTINGQNTTGSISIRENNSKDVECNSTGNPDPTFQWKKPVGSSAAIKGHTLTFSKIRKTDKGSYTCNASNVMNPTGKATVPGTHSLTTLINVLYAPSMLLFYYDKLTGPLIPNKIMDVIKGDTFRIACKSEDGEPIPTIRWSGQSTNVPILTIRQITETQTRRTCTATNLMTETGGSNTEQGIKSDNVTFNILIPPTISGCKFYYNNKPNNIINNPQTLMIKEGRSFTLTCDTDGKPPPVPMLTTPSSSSTSATSVTVNNVTRHKRGTYIFSASSVMKPTFQQSRIIIANETISVNILYPPVVANIDDISQMKGSTLQLDCPYTEGVPVETTITWTRDIDSHAWNDKQLYISSIKKTDAGIYTCNASHTMRPSGESQSYTDGDRKSFVLNVLYEASVTSFYINGKSKDTVNESSPVSFRCTADGYPTANITLNKSSLYMKSGTSNNLDFTIPKATCLDAGTYSCLAFNEYNSGQASFKTIQLYVNCVPRLADTVNEYKSSEGNETFTFTFNAIAYPVPVFTWWKLINDDWIQVKNNDVNFHISSSELQSNLTIRRLREQDFTRYKLVISNSVGTIHQSYQLDPYGKPNSPEELGTAFVKAIQVNVRWRPGFNGGLSQTFILQYKKSTDHVWITYAIEDTGERTMNYTLTKLEPDTSYNILFYVMNRVGNSSTITLVVHTLKSKSRDTNTGAVIGGVTGGCLAVLIVVGMLILLRRYQCFKKTQSDTIGEDDDGNRHGYQNVDDANPENARSNTIKGVPTAIQQSEKKYETLTSRSDAVTYSSLTNSDGHEGIDVNVQYEGLDSNRGNPSTYSSLTTTTKRKTEEMTYENLKLD